jgi:hypothetical protein
MILDGAPTYIQILKYYLNYSGITGLNDYTPKNYKTFEPMGVFMMEIEPDPRWDRPRLYAILSLAGNAPGTLTDVFYAPNWDEAVDAITEEANRGIRTSKLMEVRTPAIKKALEASFAQGF